MPPEQRKGIRALRRLYLGRLGDVLRQRQAINAQLRSAVPSVEGGRQLAHEYLTVRCQPRRAPCPGQDCSPASTCGASSTDYDPLHSKSIRAHTAKQSSPSYSNTPPWRHISVTPLIL